ncbi:STAS domain-containing protein [Micromonospora sp. NPDC049836]|uniref:STAS domain-containing protein n=1 Tax=Micromonospora sp. NPDC049836 TaxID=3364274 RepID=UPI0037B761FD
MPPVDIEIIEEPDLPLLPESGAAGDRVRPRSNGRVIDLSECRHVDAAAIGLLLAVQRRFTRRGDVFTVRAPHAQIRRLLGTAHPGRPAEVVASPAPAAQPSHDNTGLAVGPARGNAPASPTTGRRGRRR